MKKTRKNQLLVAVVVNGEGQVVRSQRTEGDWSAFVGTDAVTRAIKARNKWTATERYGPYRILTGTLTGEVTVPANYKITPLKVGRE